MFFLVLLILHADLQKESYFMVNMFNATEKGVNTTINSRKQLQKD